MRTMKSSLNTVLQPIWRGKKYPLMVGCNIFNNVCLDCLTGKLIYI